MAKGDLDPGLLLTILKTVAESVERRPPMFPISTAELMNLVPSEIGSGSLRLNYLLRHVDYLEAERFLAKRNAGVHYSLRITSTGQKVVQPELADFGQNMLPQVVKALENQILTYPEDREGMIFRLREAVAKQVPEVIAKVIVEIVSKAVSGK